MRNYVSLCVSSHMISVHVLHVDETQYISRNKPLVWSCYNTALYTSNLLGEGSESTRLRYSIRMYMEKVKQVRRNILD